MEPFALARLFSSGRAHVQMMPTSVAVLAPEPLWLGYVSEHCLRDGDINGRRRRCGRGWSWYPLAQEALLFLCVRVGVVVLIEILVVKSKECVRARHHLPASRNASAAAESGVARRSARVHTGTVALVLLDVRRCHDEVADHLPRAATRVLCARVVPLVVRRPARAAGFVPAVGACWRRHALVLRNGTCGHVLWDRELRQSLGKRESVGPNWTRKVELDSSAGDWCLRDSGRGRRTRKRQMFLVELLLFLGPDEAVVAVRN